MKTLFTFLILTTFLSCINNDKSKTKKNVSEPPNESIQPAVNWDSLDYTQRYDTSKPEGQQSRSSQDQSKRKVQNCIFFLCTVKEKNKVTTYYSQYYNLEKSGFVAMQLSINRLQDCLKKEITRTYSLQGVTVEDVTIGVQKFSTQKDAEEWYFQYIKNMKAYPYNSECIDL